MFFFSFGELNVESIHHWHPGRTIFCSLALTQTQFFHIRPNHGRTSRKHHIHTTFRKNLREALYYKTLTKMDNKNVGSSEIHVFVFTCNSIILFSLRCLEQNYDFCLKVPKRLLSVIFRFNMISAWYLALRAVFYLFHGIICRRRFFS